MTVGDVEADYIARWDPVSESWQALRGSHDPVYGLAVHSGGLYAGGENFIDRWDLADEIWKNIGTVDGFVFALLGLGDYLYIGGGFSQVNGLPAANVARWHIPTETWEAVGAGTNRRVLALESDGSQVFVGGGFTEAGGVPAKRLAAWDLAAQVWSELGGGVDGISVRALDYDDGTLLVGGWFTQTGSLRVENIAAWNGAQWQAMGSGLNGEVRAISASSSGIYAGGQFYGSGDPLVWLDRAALWDAAAQKWIPLGAGLDGPSVDPHIDPDGCSACAIVSAHGQVYFGGNFHTAGGSTALHAAAWDPLQAGWQALYSGLGGNGLDEKVLAIAVKGTDVYVGGWFERAGPQGIPYLARWDTLTHTWHALGQGLDGGVYALAFIGDDLYAGGRFSQAGGLEVNNLARWDTVNQTWHPVGTGTDPGPTHWVEALASDGGLLYVGGYFDSIQTGNLAYQTDYFAVLDTVSGGWTTVDAGLKGPVFSILPNGSDVFVGGGFYQSGGSDYEHVARLDTNTGLWHAVGTGLGSNVHALKGWDGQVVASGAFPGGVRRWNQTEQLWELLPGGGVGGGYYYGSIVYSLAAAPNGDLIAGGMFDQAGGVPANNLAQYSQTCDCWIESASGTNARVQALALLDDQLFAGGEFSLAGGRPSMKVASLPVEQVACLYLPLSLR